MTPETKSAISEYIKTLEGIRDGKPWQASGLFDDDWFSAYGDPFTTMSAGYKIRLKPEPDPYAELKAAHATGKVIQVSTEGYPWADMIHVPQWNEPVECYRIKPTSVIPGGTNQMNCPFCGAPPLTDSIPARYSCGTRLSSEFPGTQSCLARQELWPEVQRLRDIIRRASAVFAGDGNKKRIDAAMFYILSESTESK